ncbi:MAG: putative acyltransferase [Candidatus Kaiserbacteria bacterium]|nr:putative acyltransferase [Candidatus Kaiserbacteria bacterium]
MPLNNMRAEIPLFIGIVRPERIINLRRLLLRAESPSEDIHFNGDDNPVTLHYAAFQSNDDMCAVGEPIGCVTVMLNSYNREPAWQLRGMAVEENHRNCGVGARILKQVEWHLPKCVGLGHVKLMWCNAREPAVTFYKRNGWNVASSCFDNASAGLHFILTKQL